MLSGLLVSLGGFWMPLLPPQELCVECISVRVGPTLVVRGPFPDELDASFTALRLPDGMMRGFSANGSTYAIDGQTLWDMDRPRREVMAAGPAGAENECGRWLTSALRVGEEVLGFVHQESICDYGPGGQTDKTMAIARSSDDGLTWSDLGTVISGGDAPRPGTTSGEGDCSLVDGHDGFLYGYCLRSSDWQTIVTRAPKDDPANWLKYFEGDWTEPGLDGAATDIGFVGTGAGFLRDYGWIGAVSTDPWFGGVRLALSTDKINFVDLNEPLLTIDDSDWDRPADTDLIAYGTLIDPLTGSSTVTGMFVLSYIYVPPGEGFESRYLVHHTVKLTVEPEPVDVQVGMALTRWVSEDGSNFVTSTGPLTGDRLGFAQDSVVTHMLTRAPEGIASIKFEECSRHVGGRLEQIVSDEGSCETLGYQRERTAGWLFASEQDGTNPVYRCTAPSGSSLLSAAEDCEGFGTRDFLLGYGLAP